MWTYIILLIILFVIMIIYGGLNKIKNIEYDYSKIENIKNILWLEHNMKNIKEYYSNYNDITNNFKKTVKTIPNLQKILIVKIHPKNVFNLLNNNIKNFNNDDVINFNEYMMIIFNHNQVNDLELILNTNYECIQHSCNNMSYNYDLTKKITLADLYPIYNNSNNIIEISLFIVKRPFFTY